MDDRIVYGIGETGTWQTGSPTPHVTLNGGVPDGVSIVKRFDEALSSGDVVTVTVRIDADNWSCYGYESGNTGTVGPEFTSGNPDILDFSAAHLLASKGMLSPGDPVEVWAELPEPDYAQPSYDTAQLLRDAGVPSNPTWTVVTIGAITRGDGGGGNWYWDAASTADDNLGTVLNPTGNAGDGRWLRDYSQMPNVRWFGAAGDGVTDDTDAIQATVDVNIGAYFPPGDFSITNTIIVVEGSLVGERGASTITNSGVGTDAILYGMSSLISHTEIKNLSIIGETGSGHLLTFGASCAYSTFHGLELISKEPASSLIQIRENGVYDCKFTESSYRVLPTATAYPIDIQCSGTFFNENVFFNIRMDGQEAIGTPFVNIEVTGSAWLENNVFQNINIQNGPGGFIRFAGCSRLVLRSITMWDTSVAYARNIIDSVTSGNYENIDCVVENYRRMDDLLDGTGFHDIALGPASNTVLCNINTETSKSPSIDCNSRSFVAIGTVKTLTNLSSIKNYTIVSSGSANGITTPNLISSTILAGKDIADNGATNGFESSSGATYVSASSVPLRVNRIGTTGNAITLQDSGVTYGYVGAHASLGTMKVDFNGSQLLLCGNGTPEGNVAANHGSVYLRKDGGTGSSFYVKETGGTGNTGWTNYAGGGGEANTGENIGTGVEVYAGMNGTVLQSRSIIDTANVEWTQGATELSAFVPANTFDTFGAAAAVNAAKWGTGDTVDHWFDTHQSFTLTGNQSVNLTAGHDIKVVGDSSDRNVDFLVTPPTAGQAVNWVVDYDNSANAMTVTWLANGSGLNVRPTPLPSLSGGRYLLSFRLTANEFQWISSVELA